MGGGGCSLKHCTKRGDPVASPAASETIQFATLSRTDRDDAFAKGCRAFPQLMIVRRDLDLLPAGAKGHLYRHC